METQGTTNGDTGSCKGNPDPSARGNDQQRRPSPNLETGARSSGSVRSDRSNKFWSPGTNAPPATRASKHTPETSAPRDGATSIHPSPSQSARGRGAKRTQGMPAKGQINGRGFGRRRAPFAAGPRLRHEDVQNYPMIGDATQQIGRREGPRTGDAGSDRTREVGSPTSRSKAAMSHRATLRKTKQAQQPKPVPFL